MTTTVLAYGRKWVPEVSARMKLAGSVIWGTLFAGNIADTHRALIEQNRTKLFEMRDRKFEGETDRLEEKYGSEYFAMQRRTFAAMYQVRRLIGYYVRSKDNHFDYVGTSMHNVCAHEMLQVVPKTDVVAIWAERMPKVTLKDVIPLVPHFPHAYVVRLTTPRPVPVEVEGEVRSPSPPRVGGPVTERPNKAIKKATKGKVWTAKK